MEQVRGGRSSRTLLARSLATRIALAPHLSHTGALWHDPSASEKSKIERLHEVADPVLDALMHELGTRWCQNPSPFITLPLVFRWC